MKKLFLSLLVLFMALSVVGTTTADTGLAITVGQIDVEEVLLPGKRYELPSVGVINTSSTRQSFNVGVGYLSGQQAQRPPASWLKFEPQEFTLEAGKAQQVEVHLTLPAGAEAGKYFAYLEAEIDTATDQSLQGTVATKLSFAVAEGSWLDAKRRQINQWLDDAAPWPYIIAGLCLLGVALWATSRRLKFRLPFEPR